MRIYGDKVRYVGYKEILGLGEIWGLGGDVERYGDPKVLHNKTFGASKLFSTN